MKKLLLICVTALFGTVFADSAVAQETKITVELVVEKQVVTAGPYARYAQKYLGVTAPLADKVIHEITAAKILHVSELQNKNSLKKEHPKHHRNHTPVRLNVDKISIAGATQSLEESARAAAEGLFRLRKSRLDLITGDAGENVFGEGLRHALLEIDRLEREYLALFLGTHSFSTDSLRYEIAPSHGVQTYTFCRFSEKEGALAEDDMSGAPVVLELKTIVGSASTDGLDIAKKPTSKTKAHNIVPDVRCRVIFDGRELATETLPITQFGQTVHLNQ